MQLAAWIPTSFDEACKRNAGRRKLHRRMRQARADRIVRILASMDVANATELRESAYGWLTITAQAMNLSKATASRDFALVRCIHRQFERLFGRRFDPKKDQIVWSWQFDHYAFKTPESRAAGYPNLSDTSHSTLANRKPKRLIAASISCPGRIQTTSHS